MSIDAEETMSNLAKSVLGPLYPEQDEFERYKSRIDALITDLLRRVSMSENKVLEIESEFKYLVEALRERGII